LCQGDRRGGECDRQEKVYEDEAEELEGLPFFRRVGLLRQSDDDDVDDEDEQPANERLANGDDVFNGCGGIEVKA